MFDARFVDEIKQSEQGLRKKSRFLTQNYDDVGAKEIAKKAPTVQRFLQKTSLYLPASMPKLDPFLRDIIQAYIQSLTKLGRRIFISAPKELGLGDERAALVLDLSEPPYQTIRDEKVAC